jgi:hypothetical protein
MKKSLILAGAFYSDGKKGLRKAIVVLDDCVTFEVIWAKVHREWNTRTQSWDSVVGRKSTMSLTSFATWAKVELTPDAALVLLKQHEARCISLTHPEAVFMRALLAKHESLTDGVLVGVERSELSTVNRLIKKGLLSAGVGKEVASITGVLLTELGAAWLSLT